MTSANGNIFRITGPLWRESAGQQWIPCIKAIDAEQTIETPVIWGAIVPIMTSL